MTISTWIHKITVLKFPQVYTELEAIGAASAESRARRILAVRARLI